MRENENTICLSLVQQCNAMIKLKINIFMIFLPDKDRSRDGFVLFFFSPFLSPNIIENSCNCSSFKFSIFSFPFITIIDTQILTHHHTRTHKIAEAKIQNTQNTKIASNSLENLYFTIYYWIIWTIVSNACELTRRPANFVIETVKKCIARITFTSTNAIENNRNKNKTKYSQTHAERHG